MFDNEMRYLAASKRWLVDCGIAGQNVIGRCHYEVFPDLPDSWKEAHRRGLSGETLKSEDTWTSADKAPHAIRWEIQPWMTSAGGIGGITIFMEDNTALHRSEQQYRALVENMNEGLATMRVIYDDAGQPVDFEYLSSNPEFQRLVGGQEVIGKRISEVFPGVLEEHPELLPFHHLTATTGAKGQFEAWFSHAKRWFSVSTYRPQEGQFVVLLTDVTARKEAEAEQQRSAELLRKTGELSQVGGWELDPATGAVQWTDEIVRIHDLAPAGASDLQRGLSYYHPDSRPIIERAVTEAIELGRPYDLELQLISAKGVHKWVRTMGEAVMKNGKVVRVVGSLQDITERKRLELALELTKERAELAVRIAGIGEWEFSPQTGLAIQSLRHAHIFGYDKPQADWSIEKFLTHVVPEMREEARRQVQAYNTKDSFEFQTQVRRLDGELRWIWIRGQVWRDVHNQPERIFGTALDVTERRQMQAELEKYQSALKSVFDNVSIGLYRTTPDGQILMANPAMCRMMGYANESELRTRNLESEGFEPTYDRSTFRRALEAAGELIGYEAVWYRRDGTRIYVRESAKAFRNADGVIEYYEGTVEDISERRQAEQAREQSEARLRDYWDNAPSPILVADADGLIVDCNPQATAMLGYTREELQGMSVMSLNMDDDATANQAMAMLYEKGRADAELYFLAKDGQRIWVALTAVRMANGYSIGFLSDISEIRASRELLRELEEQFRQAQKMEAIGRLAGGIAHDFNNLLMIITAHAEQLTMDPASVESRAQSISKAANRAADLTGKLLAFSRKQTIQPTVTTFGTVVAGVSDMLTRLVGEDVEVEIRRESKEWPVQLDRSQFEQAVLNLAVNARDAMPSGGRLTIESVNCIFDEASTDNQLHLAPGEYVRLSVSDTGTGMSEDVKKRVFEPFFTTKEVGKGTGLGLAMVYGIVKQSGGDVAIRSTLGKGTQVLIYLPRVQTPPEAGIEAKLMETPVQSKPTGQILIVEDEETLREVLYEMLTCAGYKVIQSGNVEQAIALCLEHKESIDLLLTDVVLKGGNGREMVRTLNTMGCNFKVLYMSGYTPDSIVQHGVLEPGTYFIQKPFSQSAIVKKVEEILNIAGAPPRLHPHVRVRQGSEAPPQNVLKGLIEPQH